MTDFDGSGNIAGTDAAPTFTAVDRNDVAYFLNGAAVDTGGRSLADAAFRYADDTGGGTVAAPPTRARADGVRSGASARTRRSSASTGPSMTSAAVRR